MESGPLNYLIPLLRCGDFATQTYVSVRSLPVGRITFHVFFPRSEAIMDFKLNR